MQKPEKIDQQGKPLRPLRVLAWPARRKRSENPYTYLVQQSTEQFNVSTSELTPLRMLSFKWDIIHIHWPEMILTKRNLLLQVLAGFCLLSLIYLQRKLAGAKVVWTFHNEQAHELYYRRWGELYMRAFARLVDGVIFLTSVSRKAFLSRYPELEDKPYTVARLGNFKDEYPQPLTRPEAKEALEIECNNFVFLFFGQIRPYKNVPHLVRTFRALEGENITLVIAGKPFDNQLAEEVQREAAGDARIRLDLDFVTDERLGNYIAAADMVILPFSRILNSATVMLALSLGRRVLTADTPEFNEIKTAVGDDWLLTFPGQLSVADLRQAIVMPVMTGEPDLSEFDWSVIGKNTAELFHRLAGAGLRKNER